MNLLVIVKDILSLDVVIKIVIRIKNTKLHSKILNTIYTLGLKILYRERYKLIQKNKVLSLKYQGDRCFILGNGPSLDDVDFSLLADENVFTVNRLMLHPDYPKLKSNYHLWMDPVAFETDINYDWLSSDRSKFMNEIKQLPENGCHNLFVPTSAQDSVLKNSLDKQINIFYLADDSTPISNHWINTDLTKVISGAITVIHYAIICAIYMGFNEIYLLGCDSTIITSYLDIILNNPNRGGGHCLGYEDSDEVSGMQDQYIHFGLLSEFNNQIQLFIGYQYLNDYCQKENIKLVNLTEKSLIDSIPRGKLEDIILK